MEIFGYTLSSELVATLTSWGMKVIGGLAILVVGRMFAGAVRRMIRKALERGETDATLIPFLTSMAYYVLMVLVVLSAIAMVGFEVTSFIAVLGAAGLAVGLALQGTLANFASGVMLLTFRPFAVDDLVEAGGSTGVVKAIGLFSTTLYTLDNVVITVPNGTIFGDTVKNYTANDTRRIDLVIGVDYGDDIGTAMAAIKDVLSAEPRVLADPAPQVAVSELGDSSVNFVVRPWCKTEEYWDVRFDLTRALKERIEAAGCSFPFPQRDVHIYNEGAA